MHLCVVVQAFSLHKDNARAFFAFFKCAIPMLDDIFVFLAGVFAAQGQVESVCSMFARHVRSMFEAYVIWYPCFRKSVFAYRGTPKAI